MSIIIPDRLNSKAIYQGYTNLHITYAAHLRAYAIYSAIYGTSQSADRILERGGFAQEELDIFYPEWRNHLV